MIGSVGDDVGVDWLREAGPARARIKFVGGAKQGFLADDVDVEALAVVVPVLVLERGLGAAALSDLMLKGSQNFFELVTFRFFKVGFGHQWDSY